MLKLVKAHRPFWLRVFSFHVIFSTNVTQSVHFRKLFRSSGWHKLLHALNVCMRNSSSDQKKKLAHKVPIKILKSILWFCVSSVEVSLFPKKRSFTLESDLLRCELGNLNKIDKPNESDWSTLMKPVSDWSELGKLSLQVHWQLTFIGFIY